MEKCVSEMDHKLLIPTHFTHSVLQCVPILPTDQLKLAEIFKMDNVFFFLAFID